MSTIMYIKNMMISGLLKVEKKKKNNNKSKQTVTLNEVAQLALVRFFYFENNTNVSALLGQKYICCLDFQIKEI